MQNIVLNENTNNAINNINNNNNDDLNEINRKRNILVSSLLKEKKKHNYSLVES